MSAYQWWNLNYRKVIFSLILILAIIPQIFPIILPLPISEPTRMFYDKIESLPEGSAVLFLMEWSSGAWGEVAGGVTATLNRLGQRHLKVILANIQPESPALVLKIFGGTKSGGDKFLGTYGTDWVFLGYLAGGETATAMMVAPPNGFENAFAGVDYFNTPFSQLPIMSTVKCANQLALVITATTNGPGLPVRQLYTPFKVPVLVIDIGVDWPEDQMFISSGQQAGGLASMRGSAEYEALIGAPGLATSSVGALSINHLAIIGLLIIGNIEFLYARSRDSSDRKAKEERSSEVK